MTSPQDKFYLLASVKVILVSNVPSDVFRYGPFLDRTANGIPEKLDKPWPTSPFAGWADTNANYRLCWNEPGGDRDGWEVPQVCDASTYGDDVWDTGLLWVPQHYNKEMLRDEDRLMAMWAKPSIVPGGPLRYKILTTEAFPDNTDLVMFTSDRSWDKSLNFEFQPLPGDDEVNAGVYDVAIRDDSPTTPYSQNDNKKWRPQYFFVCDYPVEGGVGQPDSRLLLFLNNPYQTTTNPDWWANIPCEMVTLRVQTWHEQHRPRDFRDEQPDQYPKDNIVQISDGERYITKFTDKWNEVEPHWTPEEIQGWQTANNNRESYTRPYVWEKILRDLDSISYLSTLRADDGSEEYSEDESRPPQNLPLDTDNSLDEDIRMRLRNTGGNDPVHEQASDENQASPRNNVLNRAELRRLAFMIGNSVDGMLRAQNLITDAQIDAINTNRASRVQTIQEQPSQEMVGFDELLNETPDQTVVTEPIIGTSERADPDRGEPGIGDLAGGNSGSDSTGSAMMQNAGPDRSLANKCGKFVGKLCKGITNAVTEFLDWAGGPPPEDAIMRAIERQNGST